MIVYAAQPRPRNFCSEVRLRTSSLKYMRLYQGRLKKSFFKLTCMQFSRNNPGLYYLCPMGLSGLEPPTSRLSGVRSNQLSYKPILEYLIPYRFSNAVFPEPSEQVPRSRESSHASSYTLMSGSKLPSIPVFSVRAFGKSCVEMKRFELSTPCLQGRCSPN